MRSVVWIDWSRTAANYRGRDEPAQSQLTPPANDIQSAQLKPALGKVVSVASVIPCPIVVLQLRPTGRSSLCQWREDWATKVVHSRAGSATRFFFLGAIYTNIAPLGTLGHASKGLVMTRKRHTSRAVVVLAIAFFCLRVPADIYRWDTGEVIPHTEDVSPQPGAVLAQRTSAVRRSLSALSSWDRRSSVPIFKRTLDVC